MTHSPAFRRAICSILGLALALLATPVLSEPILVVTEVHSRTLYSLDLASGTPTEIGNFGVPGFMAGLAYDSEADILYGTTTDINRLYRIDRTSGVATLIGDLGVELMHGLAFDNSTGTLYGTFGMSQGDGLYRIDTATGQATLVGHIGFFLPDPHDTVHGLGFHPATNVLYGSIAGPAADGILLTIDTSTGQGTVVGPMPVGIGGLAFHPETFVLYGIDNGVGLGPDGLYTIDVATGAATLVGSTGLSNPLGLAFVASGPIPTADRSWGSMKALFR